MREPRTVSLFFRLLGYQRSTHTQYIEIVNKKRSAATNSKSSFIVCQLRFNKRKCADKVRAYHGFEAMLHNLLHSRCA